jgi:hypothetical protein
MRELLGGVESGQSGDLSLRDGRHDVMGLRIDEDERDKWWLIVKGRS